MKVTFIPANSDRPSIPQLKIGVNRVPARSAGFKPREWEPTSKSLLCPICGHDHGCKLSDELVMCLRGISSTDGPEGWRYVKPLANGMGGLWAPSDDRPRAQHRFVGVNRVPAREAIPAREASPQKPTPLSAEARDPQYRRVLAQLDLDESDRQHLNEVRGLDDRAIEACGFKTWHPRIKVEGASPQLAGIDSRGKRLVGRNGLFIPAYSPAGQLVGGQLRPSNQSKGKYVWLSSHSDRTPNGPGPQLPNEELPLFTWRRCSAHEAIIPFQQGDLLLTEGGLKSAIAHIYAGVPALGAAGGQFGSETLRDYLAQMAPARLVLCPDAGAVHNPSVAVRMWQVVRQVQAWGYELAIAWWGQTHKESGLDIDELLQAGKANEIDLLSPEEYLALHPVSIRERLTDTPQRPGLSFSDYPVRPPLGVLTRRPALAYQPGERLDVWREQILNGVRFTLDSSATGAGKSHSAGQLTPAMLEADTILYLTSDPRNVDAPTFSGWNVLQGRHGGLVRDSAGKLRRFDPLKHEGPVETSPNCARHAISDLLTSRGHRAIGAHICPSCPFASSCKSGKGGPYNYQHQRQQARESDRTIAHPASVNPHDIAFDTVIAIDEASQIGLFETLTVSVRDVERAIADLRSERPDVAAEIEPALLVMRATMMLGDLPKHGLDHGEVLDMLPEPPSHLQVWDLEEREPYLPFLTKAPDGETDLRDLPPQLRRRYGKLTDEQHQQANEAIGLAWLGKFWDVWSTSDRVAGRFRMTRSGQLQITTANAHLLTILKHPNVRSVLLLDATEPVETFDSLLGESVAHIRQADPAEVAEVEVKQVAGLGMMSTRRGKKQAQQAQAVINALQKDHLDAKTIELSDWARDSDRIYFRDSRGSNDHQNDSAVILSGLPMPNLGALTDRYAILMGCHPTAETTLRSYPIHAANTSAGGPFPTRTLTESTDEGLAAYIRQCTLSEIEQGIGRLRANRRPGEKLTAFILSDYPLNRTVELLHADDIAPPSDEGNTTASNIERAIARLTRKGDRATLRAVAARAKCSPATVQSSAAWKAYRESDRECSETIGNVLNTRICAADRLRSLTQDPGKVPRDRPSPPSSKHQTAPNERFDPLPNSPPSDIATPPDPGNLMVALGDGKPHGGGQDAATHTRDSQSYPAAPPPPQSSSGRLPLPNIDLAAIHRVMDEIRDESPPPEIATPGNLVNLPPPRPPSTGDRLTVGSVVRWGTGRIRWVVDYLGTATAFLKPEDGGPGAIADIAELRLAT